MSKSDGCYLYAVTVPDPGIDLSTLPGVLENAGGRPGTLEILVAGAVAGVTSSFRGERVRPERRNLAAHQGVLRAFMERGIPFLPVAFGTVSASRSDVAALLEANRDALIDDLTRLGGKVEMGLKIVWDVPNIFEFFVCRNPELAEQRDRLMLKPGGATHDEKIDLGQTFEAILQETRERHIATVRRSLKSCAREIVADPPRDEKMVMNLSCLIERSQEKEFEAAVYQAAAVFDNNYALDYSGPWPPFHFVRVTLADAPAGLSRR